MAEIRVCELAKELGRQNREVIEVLKANGVDVKSHMSRLEEPCVRMIKEKFLQMGKEQITKVENSRTEEKTVHRSLKQKRQRLPKRKKILSACITRRMQATAGRTDQNVRQQIKNQEQDLSRDLRRQREQRRLLRRNFRKR